MKKLIKIFKRIIDVLLIANVAIFMGIAFTTPLIYAGTYVLFAIFALLLLILGELNRIRKGLK